MPMGYSGNIAKVKVSVITDKVYLRLLPDQTHFTRGSQSAYYFRQSSEPPVLQT